MEKLFDLFDEYEEYDDIINNLRSLLSNGDITNDEYNTILSNYDEYLKEWENQGGDYSRLLYDTFELLTSNYDYKDIQNFINGLQNMLDTTLEVENSLN